MQFSRVKITPKQQSGQWQLLISIYSQGKILYSVNALKEQKRFFCGVFGGQSPLKTPPAVNTIDFQLS